MDEILCIQIVNSIKRCILCIELSPLNNDLFSMRFDYTAYIVISMKLVTF